MTSKEPRRCRFNLVLWRPGCPWNVRDGYIYSWARYAVASCFGVLKRISLISLTAEKDTISRTVTSCQKEFSLPLPPFSFLPPPIFLMKLFELDGYMMFRGWVHDDRGMGTWSWGDGYMMLGGWVHDVRGMGTWCSWDGYMMFGGWVRDARRIRYIRHFVVSDFDCI